MKFWIDRVPFCGELSIYLADDNRSPGHIAVAQPVTFEAQDESESILHQEPMFTLKQAEAQQLMDELWQNGLRPSEGSGSAGQLAATQKHLGDMQKIAFHFIDKGDA